MNKFRLDGLAVIKHINTRKEGPDEEKELAIDVKMEATVDAAYWDFFHEGLRDSLYTDIGAVRNPLMDAIGFSHSVRNCTLDLLGASFNEVEVSKFKLRPKDGNKVALQFAVSLSPRGNEVGQLAEFLQEETEVHIEPQPELNFDGGQAAAA